MNPSSKTSAEVKASRLVKTVSLIPQDMDNVVHFRAYIRSINCIDTQNQRFYIDLWVAGHDCKETSSTNAFQNSYGTDDPSIFPKGDDFCHKPKWTLNFMNSEELEYAYLTTNQPTVRYYADEEKFYVRQVVQGYIHQSFDLEDFPFDKQVLQIRVSLDVNARVARFEEKSTKIEFDKMGLYKKIIENTEWEVTDDPYCHIIEQNIITGKLDVVNAGDDNHHSEKTLKNIYSHVEIRIPVQRRAGYYVIGMIVPLALISIAAEFICLGFAGKNPEVEDQLSYLATLLLAAMTVRWTCIEKMPKITYVCFLDKIFLGSIFHLFFLMLVVAVKEPYLKDILPSLSMEAKVFGSSVSLLLLFGTFVLPLMSQRKSEESEIVDEPEMRSS